MSSPITEQNYAFITGAGSGIGAEVARRLDQAGYQLIISGSNRAKLEAMAGSLERPPIIEVSNLTDREAVKALCQKLRMEYAGLADMLKPGADTEDTDN